MIDLIGLLFRILCGTGPFITTIHNNKVENKCKESEILASAGIFCRFLYTLTPV